MIRTRDLQANYGATTLRFADVDWPQGSTALLRGASGSGKSTWLALVSGLKPSAAGTLTVAGEAIHALKPAQADAFRARNIALLPQQLQLFDALTVADNLSAALWAAGVPRNPQSVHAALSALGVADLHARLPHQLSGGQAQRVALARALLLKPQVLLADEPTASLDDANAALAIEALLQAQRASGASLVIATHDSRVATSLVPSLAKASQRTFELHLGVQSMNF